MYGGGSVMNLLMRRHRLCLHQTCLRRCIRRCLLLKEGFCMTCFCIDLLVVLMTSFIVLSCLWMWMLRWSMSSWTPSKKYRLRSKVDIENVAEEFSCWQRYGGGVEEPEAASGVDRSGGGWQWFKDPRLDCLGFRGVFPSNTIPPLVDADAEADDKETDEENYLLWRIVNGVAEGSTEIPKGEAIPLEYNLVGLNAINFDKGCYVGQEFIARTHHRGTIRKRLLPLKFLNDAGKELELEQKVAPRSEVIDATSGNKVGTVTTALGCCGFGLLRLDEAFKGSATLIIREQQDVKVEAITPKWWPSEWLQEHQQRSAVA